MKRIKLFVMTMIAITLVACGNEGKINPTSKKINGPLGKFFEVVERDYKISDDEFGVEFKRIAEGGPNDASWDTHPTFLVELQDEDGNTISTKNTDVVFTKEQLETVFSLGVDETASITFKFDKTKGVVKFKVSSKWDVDNEDTSSETKIDPSGDKSVDFKGSVDKYPVTMHLEINGTQVKGSYYYDKQGANAKLQLLGTNEAGIIDINETDADGTPTGHFRGKYVNGVYSGHFITNQGKKMPFKLYEDGTTGFSSDDDSDYSDFDSDDTDLSINIEGDSSYDAFLDEYEKFWKRYMNFLKKVNKNDPDAMIEYGKLLKEYNEYNKKLQQLKGNMSIDQLNRINQMNVETMQEMQKMQKMQ